MRLLHILVIGALVSAAAYVYEIKFEATLQAERLAKLRTDARRERDAIGTLRAEWAKLDNPARIQGLAQRHLKLKPIDATQIDSFGKLPARPEQAIPKDIDDPIGAIIEQDGQDSDIPTGSASPQAGAR